MDKEKKVRFQVKIEESIHERLRKEAYEKNVSIAQLVRDALKKEYSKEDSDGKG